MTYVVLEESLNRLQMKHGSKFDASEVNNTQAMMRMYFQGPRVLVETVYESGTTFRRAGVISITYGWKPRLMLMHRVSDTGSWDLIEPNDKVVAIHDGRNYRDVSTNEVVKANVGYA